MSDMGDDFRELRAIRQAKRASNREGSAHYLSQRGVAFTARNAGAHLIVQSSGGVVDFWPGTGRWKVRGGHEGFGVRNLVDRIKQVAGAPV